MAEKNRPKTETSNTYESPVKERLPIIAYSPWIYRVNLDNGTSDWNPPTERDFEGLVECGFNSAIILTTSSSHTKSAFRYADDVGLNCILQQYYHYDNATMQKFVDDVKGYSNLAGFLLKEEPLYEWIVAGGQVRSMYDWFFQGEPAHNNGKMVFLDLAYSLSKTYVGPHIKDYPSYLSTVRDWFNPPLWCYDFNPIIDKNGSTYAILNSFYDALSNFAAIAKSTGSPFWAHCNCASLVKSDHSRPAPTAGVLRFEAFSALAYGAQGIIFKNYAQPIDAPDGTYLAAPINRKGERTDLWYMVQDVISEISRYSQVFLGCTVISTFHMKITNGVSGPMPQNLAWPLTGIVTEDGKGVLVSLLKNKKPGTEQTPGTEQMFNYAVIVSRDPFHSQTIQVKYKANYTAMYKVTEMTPNFMQDGLLTAPTAAPSGISTRKITLEPGGFAIIQWQDA